MADDPSDSDWESRPESLLHAPVVPHRKGSRKHVEKNWPEQAAAGCYTKWVSQAQMSTDLVKGKIKRACRDDVDSFAVVLMCWFVPRGEDTPNLDLNEQLLESIDRSEPLPAAVAPPEVEERD